MPDATGHNWKNTDNVNNWQKDEVDAAWSSLLEYEIAWIIGGSPDSGRTFTANSVTYNCNEFCGLVLPKRQASENFTPSPQADITVNNSSPQTFTVENKNGRSMTPTEIKTFFDEKLSNQLRAQCVEILSNEGHSPNKDSVFFSKHGQAHTDICYIAIEDRKATDFISFHAKYNNGPSGRLIGLTSFDNSIFYQTLFTDGIMEKIQDIRDAYTKLDVELCQNQRSSTAEVFSAKFNANTDGFRDTVLNYIYSRMNQLKSYMISYTGNSRTDPSEPFAKSQDLTPDLWDWRGEDITTTCKEGSKTLQGKLGGKHIFSLSFRQDPVRRSSKGGKVSKEKAEERLLKALKSKEIVSADWEADPDVNYYVAAGNTEKTKNSYYIYYKENATDEEFTKAYSVDVNRGGQLGLRLSDFHASIKKENRMRSKIKKLVLEVMNEFEDSEETKIEDIETNHPALEMNFEDVMQQFGESDSKNKNTISETRWLKLAGLLKD